MSRRVTTRHQPLRSASRASSTITSALASSSQWASSTSTTAPAWQARSDEPRDARGHDPALGGGVQVARRGGFLGVEAERGADERVGGLRVLARRRQRGRERGGGVSGSGVGRDRQQLSQAAVEHPVGGRDAVRAPVDPQPHVVAERAGDEPRLAEARPAGDDDDPSRARPRAALRVEQQRPLRLAADDRGRRRLPPAATRQVPRSRCGRAPTCPWRRTA